MTKMTAAAEAEVAADLAALRRGLERLPPDLQRLVASLVLAAESSVFRLRVDMERQSPISVLEVDFHNIHDQDEDHELQHHQISNSFHLLTSLRLVDLVSFTISSRPSFDHFLPFLLSCASSSTPFRISPSPAASAFWGVGQHWPGSSRSRFLSDPDLTSDMALCTLECRDGWTCNFHLDSTTVSAAAAASN